MRQNTEEHVKPVLREIKKRILTLNITVFVVIFSLFIILVRYLFPPIFPFVSYIPDLSVSIIVAIIIFFAVIGLYLSMRLSRETVRIIQDYSSRIDKMLGIMSDLREEVHGDILLEKIMDYALSITDSEAGSILLINEEKKLVFKIVRGEKAPLLIGTSVELGKGITGRVALEGNPVCISDVQKSEHFNPEIDAMTGFVTRSILCVPLRARSGVVGVLELLNKQGGHTYRQRDEEIIGYLADQAAISILKTRFLEDQKNYEIHITDLLLETLDFQQPEKKGHALRVARYSNIIAKALNMPEPDRKKLYFASFLHDVGFLKIRPDEAFDKETYMQHPVIGYEMIQPINFYADIAPFILHHHQRYDGYGYPAMEMKGEDIPLEARIIAIAEAFDVMVSPSSYKVPMGFENAVDELLSRAGSQFDPRLVEVFVANINADLIKQS